MADTRQRINELEGKPNRTPEEDAELSNLKNQTARQPSNMNQ